MFWLNQETIWVLVDPHSLEQGQFLKLSYEKWKIEAFSGHPVVLFTGSSACAPLLSSLGPLILLSLSALEIILLLIASQGSPGWEGLGLWQGSSASAWMLISRKAGEVKEILLEMIFLFILLASMVWNRSCLSSSRADHADSLGMLQTGVLLSAECEGFAHDLETGKEAAAAGVVISAFFSLAPAGPS